MTRSRYALPLLLALALALSCQDQYAGGGCACEPPPPAPQGLADCVKYLLGNFYEDEAVFTAGVQGCINWTIENAALVEGDEDKVLDCAPDTTVVECAVSLNVDDYGYPIPGEELTEGDLAALDLAELDPPRIPENASGVVTLKTFDCDWKLIEEHMSRPDQATVFDTWEAYTRNYLPDESAWQDYLDRSATAEREDFASEYLETINQADAVENDLFDLDPYDLYLDFRHGSYLVSEGDDPSTPDAVEGDLEPTFVFAVISYAQGTMMDSAKDEGFRQQYSVEVNIERAGARTTRIFATWAEPQVNNVDPNDPIVFALAGRESRASQLVLAELCEEQ
jgi:hypothetical protein